jgi:Cap4-like dsDNA endonuclease family protein
MADWSIPTTQLTGPRRQGGPRSIAGFAFQDAYVCLYMTYLLDSTRGIAALRYEGAQDFDLLYTDGREEYVQIKNEPNKHYTLSELRPVLQSFAIDFLEADRPTSLTFTLVARSNYINATVDRLRDRKASPEDIADVAGLLAKSTETSSAPGCILVLTEDERYNLSDQLLKQTEFLFGMGDQIDGRLSFESHACTELARHGVAGSELENAFSALKDALEPQSEFTRVDVEELLKQFIGAEAIELFEGRVELLTDDLLSRPADLDRIQQFYAGAPLDWDIIAACGDIERDQQQKLVEQLSVPSETLRLLCIVAEPGAGKSTLAWRVAAELYSKYGAFGHSHQR